MIRQKKSLGGSEARGRSPGAHTLTCSTMPRVCAIIATICTEETSWRRSANTLISFYTPRESARIVTSTPTTKTRILKKNKQKSYYKRKDKRSILELNQEYNNNISL